MKKFLLSIVALLSVAAGSPAQELIPRGAPWRYRKGDSAPPVDWSASLFDDRSWSEGPAGIGYGDGDDATVLDDMEDGYLSVFARRAFTVGDLAAVKTLTLAVSYDDGFAAYLNGVEVLRRFLGDPGTAIAHDAPATDLHEAEGFESFDLTARIPLLRTGSNVLAIEVHNQDISSSDLSLHPQLIANAPAGGGPYPPGFVPVTIASGLRSPVGVAFAPDGRLFVAEKRGVVWIVKNGAILPQPFLSLEEEVGNAGDRGLLGIALHPRFAENGWVFLLYVVDPVAGQPDDSGESIAIGRLARYTAVGDAADTASRRVLLGNSTADGFIHCHSSHAIGTVKFGLDGTLFAGAGDGAHFDTTDGGQDVSSFDPGCASTFGSDFDTGALRSQDLGAMAGKVLRIDPATGLGLPDNPYFDGNPASVRSRVWVSGLRNPFRFGVRPGSPGPGTLYIGDVGWNVWEELNVGRGGENFGWPCYEGVPAQGSYQTHALTRSYCQALGTGSVDAPLIAWHHSTTGALGFVGNCASGTAFYGGSQYPARYRGACFFADYGRNWIKIAFVDDEDRLMAIEDFASSLQRPVDLQVEPSTGDLVYVSIEAGEVRRIRYTVENRPPAVSIGADVTVGSVPLTVAFSSAGTVDPEGEAVTLSWDFGDGSTPSSLSDPVHVYASRGTFTAILTAVDERGAAGSASLVIETSNAAPEVAILEPAAGAVFYGGEVLVLRAEASDAEDGTEGLTFDWEAALHHEDHVHPEWFVSTEREPVFTPASHGNGTERFHYELRVTVTDRGGLAAQAARDLLPGRFQRGDGNLDGEVDIADAVMALLHLFHGREAPCALALDADGSGGIDITDPIRLLEHLFADALPLAPPYPACGVGRNTAGLPCAGACAGGG